MQICSTFVVRWKNDVNLVHSIAHRACQCIAVPPAQEDEAQEAIAPASDAQLQASCSANRMPAASVATPPANLTPECILGPPGRLLLLILLFVLCGSCLLVIADVVNAMQCASCKPAQTC